MTQPNERTKGLDGLRGAAAATVALNHFYNLFPPNHWTPVWKYSPLYALIVGHEAVLIFFLLSGFALRQMLAADPHLPYRRFALRRIIRIYGPYFFALLIAIAGNLYLANGSRPGFTYWFNRTWTLPVPTAQIWAHVLFLGDYNTDRFDSVFWSLVHELRISLVFPALYWLVRRMPISWAIILAIAMMTGGTLLNPILAAPNNLAETLHYAGFFVVGIVIAEHRPRLSNRYIIFVAAILFYYGRAVALFLPAQYSNALDLPVGLGAIGIVLFAIESRFFTTSVWQWLGQRSYSLYLVHAPVLYSLVYLFNLSQPKLPLLFAYLPAALLCTGLFYRFIERPLLLLSRRVG